MVWLGLTAVALGLWVLVREKSVPPPAAPADSALELKVERSGEEIVLTWNKQADVVRDAQRASLTITDGDRTSEVDLDLGTMRAGAAVYTPVTADVTFRLEVLSRDGQRRSESVRLPAARQP